MLISIDAENVFEKNSASIYDKRKKKTSPESKYRENQPQHTKGPIGQTHSKYHIQWEKLKIFPLRSLQF